MMRNNKPRPGAGDESRYATKKEIGDIKDGAAVIYCKIFFDASS